MSGEDAPRPCLENLIVPEIKKQTNKRNVTTEPHAYLTTVRGETLLVKPF
jgi:hypothetical protein